VILNHIINTLAKQNVAPRLKLLIPIIKPSIGIILGRSWFEKELLKTAVYIYKKQL